MKDHLSSRLNGLFIITGYLFKLLIYRKSLLPNQEMNNSRLGPFTGDLRHLMPAINRAMNRKNDRTIDMHK